MWSFGKILRQVRVLKDWPRYSLVLLGAKRGGESVYRLRNGLKYVLRNEASDLGVLYEVWIQDGYAPPGFEISATDTVIDIGAHVGVFALRAAREADRGLVLAFEPTEENFQRLQVNLKLNGFPRALRIQKAAIGANSGEARIGLSNESAAMHSFHLPTTSGRTELVPVLALSKVLKENGIEQVDLLKVDCEGAEYDILGACPEDVLFGIQRIAMEIHDLGPGRDAAWMRSFLQSKGFEVSFQPGACPMMYAHRVGAKER